MDLDALIAAAREARRIRDEVREAAEPHPYDSEPLLTAQLAYMAALDAARRRLWEEIQR